MYCMMYLKRGPGDPPEGTAMFPCPVGFGLRNMRLRTGLSVISMHDGARTPLSFFPVNFSSSSSSSSSSRIGLRKTAVGSIQTPTAVRTTNRRWIGWLCMLGPVATSVVAPGRAQPTNNQPSPARDSHRSATIALHCTYVRTTPTAGHGLLC
jgi:hypothetical protein